MQRKHSQAKHEHAHHVHDEWWSRGLFQPPRLLRTGDFDEYTSYESEREGSWNELFFDLIFVAAFAKNGLTFRTQLGLQHESATDWDRFMLYADFMLAFAVIERLWLEFTNYENKVGRALVISPRRYRRTYFLPHRLTCTVPSHSKTNAPLGA